MSLPIQPLAEQLNVKLTHRNLNSPSLNHFTIIANMQVPAADGITFRTIVDYRPQ